MSSHDIAESGAGAPEAEGLPFEPDSISELLSATHLFKVEVTALADSPWERKADDLEHRRISMQLRLLALYKGELNLQPAQTFNLEVEQRRESAYTNFEFHGLWSHVEPQPEVGVRYVVVSRGATDSPAALMQEDACLRLLVPGYESDILLAIEAERLYRQVLRDANHKSPSLPAARALLDFTQERSAECRDLFALYLWARVRAPLLDAPEVLMDDVLALLLAADARVEFRRTLAASVYEAALLLDPNSPPYRAALQALFALLLQPEAGPLRETLVEVQIYNLIFQDRRPRFAPAVVIPDDARRGQVRDALAGFATERARRIKSWLSSGP